MPLRRSQLAARRRAVGFSQDQLAERLKIDRSTIVRWESGATAPQPWMRLRLAQALRVSVEQLDSLLGGDPAEAMASGGLDDTLAQPASVDLVTDAQPRRDGAQAIGGHPQEEWQEKATGDVPTPGSSGETLVASDPSVARYSPASEGVRGLWEIGFDADEELMKRRAFLIGTAAAAGLGKVDMPAAIEKIRRELDISIAEERAGSHADEWQQIALDYGETYPSAAPAELIQPLMVDMLGMQVALRRNEGRPAQHDLLRVAALLSAFTAQTLTNMGQPLEARRWWRTAKNAADRSGDPYSMLWVRGREILRAIESRPIPVILGLIQETEGMTGQAPPNATIELIAAKAEALAIAGRKYDATEALGELRSESEKSLDGFSGSILSWGEERLLGTESYVYSRLGDRRKAEAATADSIRLRAANGNPSIRHMAAQQINLAFALVGSGDVSGGLGHARAIISGLPESQRDAPLVGDGRKLLDIVPLTARHGTEVKEYREWVSSLTELASTRGWAGTPQDRRRRVEAP